MQLEVGRRVAAQQRQRRVAQRAVAQASLVRLVRVRVRLRLRVRLRVRLRLRVSSLARLALVVAVLARAALRREVRLEDVALPETMHAGKLVPH